MICTDCKGKQTDICLVVGCGISVDKHPPNPPTPPTDAPQESRSDCPCDCHLDPYFTGRGCCEGERITMDWHFALEKAETALDAAKKRIAELDTEIESMQNTLDITEESLVAESRKRRASEARNAELVAVLHLLKTDTVGGYPCFCKQKFRALHEWYCAKSRLALADNQPATDDIKIVKGE